MSGFRWVEHMHQQAAHPMGGGWHAKVEVAGKVYWVSLRRGNRRGKFYGNVAYDWHATVRDEQREVHRATYHYQSVPMKKILAHAGLIQI